MFLTPTITLDRIIISNSVLISTDFDSFIYSFTQQTYFSLQKQHQALVLVCSGCHDKISHMEQYQERPPGLLKHTAEQHCGLVLVQDLRSLIAFLHFVLFFYTLRFFSVPSWQYIILSLFLTSVVVAVKIHESYKSSPYQMDVHPHPECYLQNSLLIFCNINRLRIL